jgi:hypothetical protein
MSDLRDALTRDGYKVAVRERRECSERACKADATMEWERSADVPPGWHDSRICGRHNYRTCAGCETVYRMTSTSFVGQAPSVHCAVCGRVLVEWGSSKLWQVEPVPPGASR